MYKEFDKNAIALAPWPAGAWVVSVRFACVNLPAPLPDSEAATPTSITSKIAPPLWDNEEENLQGEEGGSVWILAQKPMIRAALPRLRDWSSAQTWLSKLWKGQIWPHRVSPRICVIDCTYKALFSTRYPGKIDFYLNIP